MQIINAYANDLQHFVKALTEAVDANDEQEAARLVDEHTKTLDVFLNRILGQFKGDPDAILH